MDITNFFAVSPMDRIAGAQQYFGKGITTGKVIVISLFAAAVIAFIVFLIKQAKK
ncbi:MAG: hypothetical protein JG762_686 [Deferribacteraceae bacterium]|jgi:hypothetical protein|nr:hypothetical protein [Deferribacteraceae bacterium]